MQCIAEDPDGLVELSTIDDIASQVRKSVSFYFSMLQHQLSETTQCKFITRLRHEHYVGNPDTLASGSKFEFWSPGKD